MYKIFEIQIFINMCMDSVSLQPGVLELYRSLTFFVANYFQHYWLHTRTPLKREKSFKDRVNTNWSHFVLSRLWSQVSSDLDNHRFKSAVHTLFPFCIRLSISTLSVHSSKKGYTW